MLLLMSNIHKTNGTAPIQQHSYFETVSRLVMRRIAARLRKASRVVASAYFFAKSWTALAVSARKIPRIH